MIFALFLLSLATPGFAQEMPLNTYDVGQFGGARVQLPCDLPGAEGGLCFVDTSAAITITRETPVDAENLGPADVTGVGWQTSCDRVRVPSVHIAGLTFVNLEFLHCPDFAPNFSPLFGIDLFRGRSFTWRFFDGRFDWRAVNLGYGGGLVHRGGPANGWIALDVRWGALEFRAGWDTGAPVTLVDHAFVAAHRGYFEPSEISISESMKARGGVAYRVVAPFEVGGVPLYGSFVHAVSLSEFFGASMRDMPVILGMNHLRKADWSFDLHSNRFQARPIPVVPGKNQ